MELSQNEVNEIIKQNSKQIEQTDRRMALNYYSLSSIRYWYSLLSNYLIADFTIEDLLQIEALTTSISVAYGRLFGESKAGIIKLDDNIIPKKFLAAHNEIINLRHRRYAHHGENSEISRSVIPEYIDGKFKIELSIEVGFYFGAAKHWSPLFAWLDEYMNETLHKNIDSLTMKTGYVWEMPNGPAPKWVEH